jgi:photosynthetic reaction center cytochrome c subunit
MGTMSKYLKILALVGGLPFFILLFENSVSKKILAQKTETAGQKFKNIKVLNDMPADQMGKVMNIMKESLGVNCDFCHIGDDFEKDGKKEKEDARKMVQMTFAINKEFFAGKQEVSCSTCHNGRPHPLNVPNLNPGEIVERRQKQPEVKPLVDAILEKYTRAVSKGANTRAIESRFITALRIEPDGTSEKEEIWQKAGKLVISTIYPPSYTVTEAFDGEKAWKTSNADPIKLKEDETEQIRRTAEVFAVVDLKAVYPKLEFGALEKIRGRDVYMIRATSMTGSRERLYFDAQTGLLVRRTASSPTILGAFIYQVDYNDYKDFGGVKLPVTTRVAMPGISFTRKILKVKINAPIDDKKFTLEYSMARDL